jgi:hypothetical protein
VRAVAAVFLLAAAATPAASSLARLAEAVAGEVVRVSAGRPVDLAPPDDRTGAGLGADLHQMVRARLEGRVSFASTGDRIAVTAVLAQAGTRLVWSARLTEEPAGTAADVLSVSTTWDGAVLPLIPDRGTSGAATVDVLERMITPPVEGHVVALAFSGAERLLVLFDDAIALYRRDGLALRLESRRDLAGPLSPVRQPGGIVRATEMESACWAMTSRGPRATLFALDGGRLTAVQQADAVPWPRTPSGVRFRPGTNLLEAALPGIEGPVLALEAEQGWVVQADGVLARVGSSELAAPRTRVGGAITSPWPGLLAAAGPEAPGEHDHILLFRDSTLAVAGSVPVEGAVRALASYRHGATALLAAALEDPAGGFRLALFEIGEKK